VLLLNRVACWRVAVYLYILKAYQPDSLAIEFEQGDGGASKSLFEEL